MHNFSIRLLATLLLMPLLAASASAQLLQQSELTFKDADPSKKLETEHLWQDSRWMGLSPRSITWALDGSEVYFRWREDPHPDQHDDTDPWYAVDAAGRTVRMLAEDEVMNLPPSNVQWSTDRSVAAWSSQSTLFMWTIDHGALPVYATAGSLGDVRISSDGAQVFFATAGIGFSSSESGDLWVYERATGQLKQVARVVPEPAKSDSFDTWLEDQQLELIETVRMRKRNREVADSLRQLRRWMQPQSIPVSKGATAQDLQRSPDGRFITFIWEKAGNGERTTYLEYVNESGEARAVSARPKVGESGSEYKMGIVRVDPELPVDSIEVVWVDDGTDKETVIHGPYWNPQGTQAVVQILSMDHKDRWISKLNIETGETSVLDHQDEEAWIGGPLVVGRWRPGYLQWLPDGEHVAFASTETGWSMLYLSDMEGNMKQLTDGEWELRDAELSVDGKTWYLTTSKEHPGEEHLYHLPAMGGQLERVTLGEGQHRAYISPDGKRVAATFATSKAMPDLFLMENKAGVSKTQITKSGTDEFYSIPWIEDTIISFPDAQGETTWAKVWDRPANGNGAAVVYAHGCGECAQAVTKGWTRISAQLYANYMYHRGYTMASIDYRGSSGYGHANRTYAYRQMGISDIDSGLPLLDILHADYGVERDRIGVYGGSYGGFYTLMSLFRNPGKYAAGVALYPVTDWAHYNQGYTSRILNGTPITDEEAYRQSSPMYYAEGLQDALMIQHGLVDGNVQIQDSYRLAQKLIELDKDFELVAYPVEAHGWREPSSRRDSYKRMTRFFDQHLLGPRVKAMEGGQ